MKVVFLDIDGVLNCNTTTDVFNGILGIEDAKVQLLKHIIDKTEAKIVLTSTWKLDWDPDIQLCTPSGRYMVDKLSAAGLEIFDSTKEFDLSERGRGIKKWLRLHEDTEKWVVIDDEIFWDYVEMHIMPHLIKTKFTTGLTAELAEEAIEFLEK